MGLFGTAILSSMILAQWVPFEATTTRLSRVVRKDGTVQRETIVEFKQYRSKDGSTAKVNKDNGSVEIFVASELAWYRVDHSRRRVIVERYTPKGPSLLRDPDRGSKFGTPLRREMINGCLSSAYPVYADKAGTVVGTTWYCDEFKTQIRREEVHPVGEQTLIQVIDVRGIVAKEPDAALFRAPSGYVVIERPCKTCGPFQ